MRYEQKIPFFKNIPFRLLLAVEIIIDWNILKKRSSTHADQTCSPKMNPTKPDEAWIIKTYLNAVLIKETRHRETSLFIQELTKNNNLLKEEDSSLLHPAQQAPLRV